MVRQARIAASESGAVPEGEGWYVLNAREARWRHHDELGSYLGFEGDVRFDQLGINLSVLAPGQPNCLYHEESVQEDFLVLSGECVLVVEGEERPLGAWDFVHCPPGTAHVLVGAGSGPCVLLMVGARGAGKSLRYPVDEVALRHGASVERETTSPNEAYARFADRVSGPAPDVLA